MKQHVHSETGYVLLRGTINKNEFGVLFHGGGGECVALICLVAYQEVRLCVDSAPSSNTPLSLVWSLCCLHCLLVSLFSELSSLGNKVE
jgi:hypothetical protein